MQLKRLPRARAIHSLITRLEPLMREHGYVLNCVIDSTSTGDHAAAWEKEVDFGSAFVAVLIVKLRRSRLNVARIQYGFKDSLLTPILDDGDEDYLRFVGQFWASMEFAKGSKSRTVWQRNRFGVEQGMYDVSTDAAIEQSFALIVADLREFALSMSTKFPTRRSIYEHLVDCRSRNTPSAFEYLGDMFLILDAMYGDKERAIQKMHARLKSVFRWRRFYQLIGLDKTRTEPIEARKLQRMISFASSSDFALGS